MSDEIDTALSEYEPTDTESDVQDASVMMDQPVPIAKGPVDNMPITSGELNRIAAQPGNAPMVSAAPVQPSANPTVAAQQALAMGNETANAQSGVGDAIKIANEAKAQELEDQDVQRQVDEQERRDKEAEHNAILERTHGEVEAAQKKYSEFKFHDHWRDASPANKALAIIFSAVGGAAATRTGGQNEALRAMDDITEREYKRDMAELSKQENFIKWKREGEKDLVGRFEKERASLLVQQSERLKHMANYAQSQYLRKNPGATVEEAKNSELAAGLRQKASETYSNAVRDIYKIQTSLAAAKERAKLASGSPQAMQLFITGANALKPGEQITPALAVLGQQAGLKPNQIAAEVDKVRNSAAKSNKGEAVNGKAIGELEADLSATNDLANLIDKNPEKFKRVQEAIISYRTLEKNPPPGRSIAQFMGIARKSAEENLKDDTERDMFGRLMQQETRTAKAYGGVITESDIARAQSEQALTGASAKQFAANLRKNSKSRGIILSELRGGNTEQAASRASDVADNAGKAFGNSAPTVVETRKSASGKILEKLSDGTIRERK